MVDSDLILAKAGLVRKHLNRVTSKRGERVTDFINDLDRQDIVAFNLHAAIQNAIDIAAHIVAEEGLGVPGSVSEMFYLLEANGSLPSDVTEKMVKAVGFRNIIVHEYAKIDLQQMFDIANNHIKDLNQFLSAIFSALKIAK